MPYKTRAGVSGQDTNMSSDALLIAGWGWRSILGNLLRICLRTVNHQPFPPIKHETKIASP